MDSSGADPVTSYSIASNEARESASGNVRSNPKVSNHSHYLKKLKALLLS